MSKNKKKKNIVINHNKKILLLTIISIIVVLSLLGTTFALFIASKSSSKQDMYKVGDLNVVFSETTGSKINLSGQYPMTDESGLKVNPYTFTLTNNGDYNVSYTVKIINTNTNLPTEAIRYSINNSVPDQLSNATNGLDIGTLTPGEKRVFNLKLWIDENTSAIQAGKTYSGKIQINGQAVRIPYFVDKSGANAPVLATGLIPVVYDGANEEWVVADKEKGWYSYQNQVWANAVTVSDATLRTAESGTPIPMDKINSMWVWIPRYKYQIPSDIGSDIDASYIGITSPPEIDVVFEKNTETTGTYTEIGEYGYYTHPAFQNGTVNKTETDYDRGGWDKELQGIWAGKFETGGTATTPLIKPDISFLRLQNISNSFETSLKFSGGTMNSSTGTVTFSGNTTYGLTSSTDTHMMKNTEWGAVAYLSQSKYGKYGNQNYEGPQKEIYVNNSYVIGRSGGNVGGSTPINEVYKDQTSTDQYNSTGYYTYNDYLLEYNTDNRTTTKVSGKGTGASTTGTIYGIYDMSGGCYGEAVMGNWKGYSGKNLSINSGFSGPNVNGSTTSGISFPTQKYYDKYTKGVDGDYYDEKKVIKGDATYETRRWYADENGAVADENPWLSRGGSLFSQLYNGIFNFSPDGGSYNSFHAILIP